MSAQKAAPKKNTKRATSSQRGAKTALKKTTKSSSRTSSARARANKSAQSAAKQAPPRNPRLVQEIIGIVLAVIAIAIFIAVITPGEAILSKGVSDFFKRIIGVGAYIFPFALIFWAASFFIEKGVAASTARMGIGLTLIMLSVLGILGLTTPSATQVPELIFFEDNLRAHGGYIGGGIAWALIKLVGDGIGLVILIGVIIASVVLIGFSITGLIERVQDFVQNRMDARAQARAESAYDVNGDAKNRRSKRNLDDDLMPATARLSDGIGKTAVFDDGYQQNGAAYDVSKGMRLDSRQFRDQGFGSGDFIEGEWDPSDWDGTTWADVYGTPYDDDLGSTRRVYGDSRLSISSHENNLGQSFEAEGLAVGIAETPGDQKQKATNKKGQKSAKSAKLKAEEGSGTDTIQDLNFELPNPNMLKASRSKATSKAGENELRNTANELQSTIEEFGIDAKVQGWVAGPTVTLFKLSLGEGVRLNRINSLADDIALALAAPAVRIFSPIPGTTLVGIEVPNSNRSFVLLGDVLPDAPEGSLQLAIGKDVEGASIIGNLEKMPHLLIGGTTGSGKSVAINSMIMSVLMNATPAQVRMILIDPKMVELSLYNDIPHLYVPVVTDAQKAASALAWGVIEMERRLKLFQSVGVKNIAQYNDYIKRERAEIEKQRAEAALEAEKAAAEAKAAAETATLKAVNEEDAEDDESFGTNSENSQDFASSNVQDETDNKEEAEPLPVEMPLVLIVIDELADLMMVAGKEVETSISRLAQLARAAGLHLIIATQRPSTNVITGLIKANIVNRIAFNVASGIDSRVILDCPGAEDLIGNGDLLFSKPEYGKPQRIQGCYVSEPEIEAVVAYLKTQATPEYRDDILSTAVAGISVSTLDSGGGDDDPLIWDAADIVVSTQFGSTSTLQRRLKVGYARAGRIMDMLEQKGIVGPPNGSKPREVLLDDVLDLESLKAIERADDQGNEW